LFVKSKKGLTIGASLLAVIKCGPLGWGSLATKISPSPSPPRERELYLLVSSTEVSFCKEDLDYKAQIY